MRIVDYSTSTPSHGSVAKVRLEMPGSLHPGTGIHANRTGPLGTNRSADSNLVVAGTAQIQGARDLRQFATPEEAGLEAGSELTIRTGDGTWVTIRFESSRRLSVTKDGRTDMFSYANAAGTWPESLVRAFNSIGGGLRSSMSPDGRLSVKSEDGRPIRLSGIAPEDAGSALNAAQSLGLANGPDGDLPGSSWVQAGNGMPPAHLGALNGQTDGAEQAKSNAFPTAQNAYLESAALAGTELIADTGFAGPAMQRSDF